ncbi:SGNH/GDSL hydrolase family protein [Arthrobacter sp. SAFR-014]|uniref:SGNH/GDSL hydrolase family protein n=1 Tax=unclassified Arthrobacter TaxID=235627 RepID=UPI003F7CA516
MRVVEKLKVVRNTAKRKLSIRVASRSKFNKETLTVLGDSFVTGAPYVPAEGTFPHLLADHMGWSVRYCDGQSGTGYVARPAGNGSSSYPDRLKDLLPVSADNLLITGGYNDTWNVVTGLVSMDEVFLAVDKTLNSARSVGRHVVIVGPFWTRVEGVPHEAYTINRYLKRGAESRGFRYIDVLTDNWITPENRHRVISSDSTHPSSAGQEYIADRLALAHR